MLLPLGTRSVRWWDGSGHPPHTGSVSAKDGDSCGVRLCVPQQRGILVVSDKAFDFAV